eukprot:SAG11_NODE_12490_length_700_cov_5.668885_1_plen_210_part_10
MEITLIRGASTASTDLMALTVRIFPLSFSLGSMLTVLYYSLDYFQDENVKKRKECSKTIAPFCELSPHISHGHGLPLALLNALTLAASGHTRPCVVDLVGGYIVFYMTQTQVNHATTGAWQYPIIADTQRAAGWPGVLLFFAAIAGLMIGAAQLGVTIVASQNGGKAGAATPSPTPPARPISRPGNHILRCGVVVPPPRRPPDQRTRRPQ